MFSVLEWCDIRDHIWDCMTSGGKEEKLLKPLEPLCRAVANTLKARQPEQQITAMAIHSVSNVVSPSTSLIETPVKGLTHPACSSAAELKAAVGCSELEAAEGEAAPPPKPTVQQLDTPPAPKEESVSDSDSGDDSKDLKVLTERPQRLEVQVHDKIKKSNFTGLQAFWGQPRGRVVPSTPPLPAAVPSAPPWWPGVIRDAILEGNWEVASKITYPVVYNQQGSQWEPHDWKLLQQARKTISEYGLKSEAAKQIIQ